MKKQQSISVVIPVYGGESTLRELVERLNASLAECAAGYEIIFVNDGSPDGSWDVILGLAAENPEVRGINLMRNVGQHNALLCGVRQAKYDIIVTMDDDLQHPPEEIPKLLAKLDEGYDVVYGAAEKQPHSLWHNVMSAVTKRVLAWAVRMPELRDVAAFRAFRGHLRAAFEGYQSSQVLLDVLLSWGTHRFGAVTVQHDARRVGRTNYTLGMLARTTVLIITGFTTAPLRLASFVGLAFTLFGVGVLAYVLTLYFAAGGSVPGFPFLASVITIFSGATLFSIGIMGEYLARMYSRMMERPPYTILEEAGREAAKRAQ